DRDRGGGACAVVPAGKIDRERRSFRDGGPVASLGAEGGRAGVGGEALGPALEGGGLRRQLGDFSGREPAVGGLQVFEKDSPGDAVDDQVMGGEEEAVVPARASLEEGGQEKRSAAKVESALQLLDRGLDRLGGPLRREREEIDGKERRIDIGGGVPLLPALALSREAKAKSVVVVRESAERGFEETRIEGYPGGEEEGLVEAPGLR